MVRFGMAGMATSLLAVSLMVAGALTGGAAASASPAAPHQYADGYWVCVANQQLDVEYCQGDPTPPIGPILVP